MTINQHPPQLGQIHFEVIGGVAGDMLLASLIDLGADIRAIVEVFRSLGEPGLELRVERVAVDGEPACYVKSLAPGSGHHHSTLGEIHGTIDRGTMPETARQRAKDIFKILAEAESIVHHGTVDDVHLHEVGELDSILDIVGIAVALNSLGNPKVTSTPLPSGHGTVDTSHGLLECPVPAVQEVAKRWSVPMIGVDVEGETITPTGISVLAQSCQDYGAQEITGTFSVGVGAGTKRFESRSNIVRAHGWLE